MTFDKAHFEREVAVNDELIDRATGRLKSALTLAGEARSRDGVIEWLNEELFDHGLAVSAREDRQ